MFFLGVNVGGEGFQVGRPDGECTISVLPREVLQPGRLRLEPFRRGGFELLHELSDGSGPRYTDGEVNMVRDAADPKALAVRISGHGCQVRVEIGTCGQIEVWSTILRAEDEVNEQEGERLRHAKRIDRALSPRVFCDNGIQGDALGWYYARLWRWVLPPMTQKARHGWGTIDLSGCVGLWAGHLLPG